MAENDTMNATLNRREFADRLREESLAVRLERSQFGLSRKVSESQKDRMAELFGADAERLSANKRLLNRRHEAYQAVTGLLGRAREVWLDNTLPYPEPGLRLIRRERVEDFDAAMRAIKAELTEARGALERVYHDQLIPDARERLGDLFNASDYPLEIAGEFDIEWGFSNVDPPEYLRQISPRLYEQQQERVRARFEEAVNLAEQAFTSELAQAVEHLVERLTPSPDGKQKVFRDTALENLQSFFERFRSLNVGSNEELNALVDQAQQAVAGVDLKNIRKDVHVREALRDSMASLSTQLDGLMIDRPKRQITLEDEPAAAQADAAA